MNKRWNYSLTTLFCLLFYANSNAAEFEPHKPNVGEIRIVPVDPTPEPNNLMLRVVFPEDHQMQTKLPIQLQMRLEGYPVGVDSDFPREKEIFNDPEGQAVHIIIDDQPYIQINDSFVDSLDDNEIYYDQTLSTKITANLKPGMHIIRAFLVRSYNESLKGEGCFISSVFYYKTKDSMAGVDLNQPYLTYNEPQGDYDYEVNTPILLDFYITNCQLSKDGYKVRLTVDGGNQRIITQWTPYYIYGLSKGTHTVRLELLNPQNNHVKGLFNDVQKKFYVK